MLEPGNLHDASLLHERKAAAVELEGLENARLHDLESGLQDVPVKEGENRRSNLSVEVLSRHAESMPHPRWRDCGLKDQAQGLAYPGRRVFANWCWIHVALTA